MKAHTLLDRLAYTAPREFTRVRKTPGKLKKDDFYWHSVGEYLHDKYVQHMIDRRKGPYEPTQIVRNFWR
jgi:hypothetical protein